MKCSTIQSMLSPYVDGDLQAAQAEALGRHLQGCERCRKALDDLQLIVSAAEKLAEATPPRNLWPAIEHRLLTSPQRAPAKRPAPAPLSGWRPRIAWALSVASIFVALFLLRDHILPPKTIPPPPQSQPQLLIADQSDIDRAREHYQHSISTLEQIVAHRAHEMNPDDAALYQEKLAYLEEAIRECSLVLERNSFDSRAQRALFDAYDRKISTLREMAVSAAY